MILIDIKIWVMIPIKKSIHCDKYHGLIQLVTPTATIFFRYSETKAVEWFLSSQRSLANAKIENRAFQSP
jgi:hypothetical protein